MFDTTFLIDFQKERKVGQKGNTHRFLEAHAEKGAYLSIIAYGEYAEGFENRSDPAFVSIVESFEILLLSRDSADRYGELTRTLRAQGQLIGANDLWIAVHALEYELTLVTANTRHFARVPGLRLLSY